MRALPLVAALLLAGCLGGGEPGLRELRLDAPTLDEILPPPPEGYVLGQEDHGGWVMEAEGLSRTYDFTGSNASVHHSLRVGAMRFGAAFEASAFMDKLRTSNGDGFVEPRPGTLVSESVIGDPSRADSFAQNAFVLAQSDAYVVWSGTHARGESPRQDALAHVDAMLAKLAARGEE